MLYSTLPSHKGMSFYFDAGKLSAHISGIDLVWADISSRYTLGQARRTGREGGLVGWRRVEG